MHTKKRLIVDFVKKNQTEIVASFFFGFLSIVASIFIPVFLGKYYQIALHNHSARGKIFDQVFGNITNVKSYFIYFILLLFFKLIFDYFKKYYLGLIGELFSKSIRGQLFEKQLKIKIETHQKKEAGLYLLRYSGDLSSVQNYLTKGIISFINDLLFLLLAISIFAIINFKLTIILLVSYPVIFFAILYLNKILKLLSRKRRNSRSVNLAFVSTRLSALLTIKAFNREKLETNKYAKKSEDLFQLGKNYYKLYAFIYALLPCMLYALLGMILYTAYTLNSTSSDVLDGSVILMFIMLMVNTIPALKRILSVNFIWQAGDISFGKLLQFFNTDEEANNNVDDISIKSGSISFKNVSFGFSDATRVIKNMSFHIPENSLTLINGSQQSGKSTIYKLITGLYSCKEGEVLMDNININLYNKHSLRKNISIVSAEFPLIGKTVFETISYSRKSEKRIPAHNMLLKLGYTKILENDSVLDESIFENGKNISSSQHKILLIARALLTNKKIILLDEPFEGLDDALKEHIFNLLSELKGVHTIVVIDKNKYQSLKYDNVIDLNTC